MRNWRPFVLLFALLLILSKSSRAGEQLPAKLSINSAIAVALRNNLNLNLAQAANLDSLSFVRRNSIYSTYSGGVNAGLDRTPDPSTENVSGQLFGSASLANLAGTTASVTVSPFGTGTQPGSVTFSATQPLTSGKGLLSPKSDAVQSAISQSAVKGKQLYNSRQNTILSVTQTYYQAVVAREQVKVQENALKLAQTSTDYLQKRVDEGLDPGINVLRSAVYVAQAEDAVNQARQQARGAMDALMIAMGLGVGQTPELTDTVPDQQMNLPDLPTAIQTALSKRVEFNIYDQQISDARRQLAIKKDILRPAVNLVAGYSSTNTDTGFIDRSLVDEASWNVGVVANFPLDKRALVEDRDVSARALDTLQKQRAFLVEQVSNDVRAAYRSFDLARNSLKIFTENLAVAQQNLYVAQRMVEEGQGDSRDVVSAQQSLASVESSILSAKTNLYLAETQVKFAMGEDLTTVEIIK